jgi:glycosyltransferase involved in cell wall biosynthesis
MNCLVAIPTFNRRAEVVKAVGAALDLEGDNIRVAVVDDGSTDGTLEALRPWFGHPRFAYIGLGRNVGTARAKNVALALLPFDAITFHDSDDVPLPAKVRMQREILTKDDVTADPCLNWAAAGHIAGERLKVGCVLTRHHLVHPDGSSFEARRALSLVDDFMPNLQMNAGPPGDWILINSGLFRRSLFSRLGGFEDGVEEDRELRNRMVMAGEVIWLIEESLLVKHDSADSLTNSADTGYASERRARDRRKVWAKVDEWRRTGAVQPVPIDLEDVRIAALSPHASLALADDIPVTAGTRTAFAAAAPVRTLSAA